MHIYAFGSVCRGEVTPGSDIDLLAVVSGVDRRFDPETYSIYSYGRLSEIWMEGNPFAWHLHLESKLIFSDDRMDYIERLGPPRRYSRALEDCRKFQVIFNRARAALTAKSKSPVFELSTVYLSVRNIATCFSLGMGPTPDFSRHSALRLGADSLEIPASSFGALERARILCTRGLGPSLTVDEIRDANRILDCIGGWMDNLVRKVEGI